MNCKNIFVLLATVGLLGGCYGGLNSNSGGGADSAGDGALTGPGSADGGGDSNGDDGDGDGGDDGTPSGPDDDPPFELPGEAIELLPFHVRMANLESVVGVGEDHFVFTELRQQRYLLGDHDYANGIAPDLAWTPTKMQFWVKAMVPVCDSAQFQERYPDLVADPSSLLQQVYGRDPTSEEVEGLQEIAAGGLDAATQYRLVCVTALSSLEFVAS